MGKADDFHLITLDYLKAVCISIVIFAHCGGIKLLTIYFPFWGMISVPIFIVITGYVFTLSANRYQVQNLPSYFYGFWWKNGHDF